MTDTQTLILTPEQRNKALDPKKVRAEIHTHTGTGVQLQMLPRGIILLICFTALQVASALTINEICGVKCKVKRGRRESERHSKPDYGSRGVIYRIPLSIKMADFAKLPGLKRAIRMRNKLQKETTTVLLHFVDKAIPKNISFESVVYPVKEYIQKTLQCGNCQKFGHSTKMCYKKQPVCGKCSGKHLTTDCENEHKQCANCHGKHTAFNRTCPVKAMAEQRRTYAQITAKTMPSVITVPDVKTPAEVTTPAAETKQHERVLTVSEGQLTLLLAQTLLIARNKEVSDKDAVIQIKNMVTNTLNNQNNNTNDIDTEDTESLPASPGSTLSEDSDSLQIDLSEVKPITPANSPEKTPPTVRRSTRTATKNKTVKPQSAGKSKKKLKY